MTAPSVPRPPARSYFTALSLAGELTKGWKLSASARVQVVGTLASLFFNEMAVEDFAHLLDHHACGKECPTCDPIGSAVRKYQGLS